MFNKKYRQRKIQDMVGSTNVRVGLTTLLENNKLPNALILSGDNGIGKTSMAYSLAHNIICGCDAPGCVSCNELSEQLWGNREGSMTDVYEFDLGKDRDDRYVDSVLDVFRYAGKKVIILDEIQNLTQMNMTKFLKTFENLSDDTYLIICTTELYKLNSGIVSRCEVFELKPPNTIELAAYLETICRLEGIQYTRDGIYALARSKYRVRDAVGSLETIINIYGRAYGEDVRGYFGKEDSKYPLAFLTTTKESSPYAMLTLMQTIKEEIGIFKFSESLKETLVDAVYARYNVKPVFQGETQVNELKSVIGKFTSEELTAILSEIGRNQGRSNLDKEIALLNLGFSISNGSLLKKVGAEEELKVKRRDATPDLDDNQSLGVTPIKGEGKKASFLLTTPGELGGETKIANNQIIQDEEGLWETLADVFGGEVISDED